MKKDGKKDIHLLIGKKDIHLLIDNLMGALFFLFFGSWLNRPGVNGVVGHKTPDRTIACADIHPSEVVTLSSGHCHFRAGGIAGKLSRISTGR